MENYNAQLSDKNNDIACGGNSLGKYDFGYAVPHGSTAEWALQTIRPNSTVLEFGPFNGNLTKHLKEDLSCLVDIVELDQEAGEQASLFARDALIGTSEGDIETYRWVSQFTGRKYDYIVFLDVIEHLVHTEKVLSAVKPFLEEDGIILLSIPNIAYNGILLNLMRNRFTYTELGLLDNTHLRFFTYESICELGKKLGYAVRMGALQVPVTDSEIDAQYDRVPKHVQHYLKSREFGNVYQYLVEFSRMDQERAECPNLVLENVDNQVLFSIYVQEQGDSGFEEKKRVYCYCQVGESFHVDLDLTALGNIQMLRIDPGESPCLLSEVSISLSDREGNSVPVSVKEFNGVRLSDEMLLFSAADPQIVLDIPCRKYQFISFRCKVLLYDCPELELLHNQQQNYDENMARADKKISEEQAIREKAQKFLEQTSNELKQTETALSAASTKLAQTETMLSESSAKLAQTEAMLSESLAKLAQAEAELSERSTQIAELKAEYSRILMELDEHQLKSAVKILLGKRV